MLYVRINMCVLFGHVSVVYLCARVCVYGCIPVRVCAY